MGGFQTFDVLLFNEPNKDYKTQIKQEFKCVKGNVKKCIYCIYTVYLCKVLNLTLCLEMIYVKVELKTLSETLTSTVILILYSGCLCDMVLTFGQYGYC